MKKKLVISAVAALAIMGSATTVTGSFMGPVVAVLEFENATGKNLHVFATAGGFSSDSKTIPQGSRGTLEIRGNANIYRMEINDLAGNITDFINIRESIPSSCSLFFRKFSCRYTQNDLAGKKKFKITNGSQNPGNFIVQALD